MSIEDKSTNEKVPDQKIRRLMSLSAAEENNLAKRIEDCGGVVQVFIHPDFEEYAKYEQTQDKPENIGQLEWANQVFENIISSASQDVRPIFIFEMGQNTQEFRYKEKKLEGITSQPLFIIRTELGKPNPLSPRLENNYSFHSGRMSDEDRAKAWGSLISKLKSLGVRQIIIGGAQLHIARGVDEKNTGCLGYAMHKLESDFELKLSTITWPDGRKGLRDKEKKD